MYDTFAWSAQKIIDILGFLGDFQGVEGAP